MPFKPSQERLFVSTLEFRTAVAKLSKNKATGVDGLKDIQIKVPSRIDKFAEKMRLQFEDWLNGKNFQLISPLPERSFFQKMAPNTQRKEM